MAQRIGQHQAFACLRHGILFSSTTGYSFAWELLGRIDNDTRRAALTELLQNAKDEIEQVRRQLTTAKNGRLHAFWLHQFANTQLALTKLGKKSGRTCLVRPLF